MPPPEQPDQEVRPLNDDEIESVDAGIKLGLTLVARYGQDPTGGLSLDALDAALAGWRADAVPDRPDDDAVSTGVGCLFGFYLMRSLDGSFVMVTDATYGTSLGVQTAGTGIAYPIDSVRKRLDAPDAKLATLFGLMKADVDRLAAGGEPVGPLDLAKVFPYVVPAGVVPNIATDASGLVVPLGHGVFVTVAQELDGMCRTIDASQLPAELTPVALHDLAAQNLQSFVRGGGVKWEMYKDAAGNPAMLRCFGSWLASACVRLPNLHAFARQNLACDEVCVSLPEREEMVLFPKGDSASRSRTRQQIAEQNADAQRPITLGLFVLAADGLSPLGEG